MSFTKPRTLPIPDESRAALRDLDDEGMWRRGQAEVPDDVADHWATAVAGPVVAAVLRDLADRTKDRREVTGSASYRDGYFDGANSIRDLLIDYADELDPS